MPVKPKKPFAEGEKRTLQLPIADCRLPIERVEAEHKRTEKHPTHEARFFQLEIGNGKLEIAKVQLNHGDPADDEARLASIAEDLLAPELEEPITNY